MNKAISCAISYGALLGAMWSAHCQAQTACSYFSSPANCAPTTGTSSDSASKSNAQKNANSQQVVVPQSSSFTQKNSSDDQSWNTQQKLYTSPRVTSVQQDSPSPQKSSTQQSGSQPGTSSRQVQSSLLDANSGNSANRITDGNMTNNGILKISTRNLTSTSPNSLAGGAGMSNGSVLNSGNAPSGGLSSAMAAKVRTRAVDDDQPAAGTKSGVSRSMPRRTPTSPTSSTSSKSKPAESKPKDSSNCIFVGMQQVCG